MPRARTLFAMLAAILLAAATYAGTAVAASPPSAPASCTANLITGTPDDFRITWTRPSSDGGAPIWRYAIKVKGQPSPVVRLRSANKQTENLVRSYDWTGAVKGTTPLTFRVRAVNSSGFGAWCNAVPGKEATPTPTPTSTPTASPTPTATATASATVTASATPTPTASSTPTPTPTASASATYTPTPTAMPTPTSTPQEQLGGAPFVAYGESSFFQSELTGAPIDTALTTQFRSFMATHPEQTAAYPLIRGVGSNQWGMVHDLADCSDPVWKIGTASGSSPSEWAALKTTGFHASADLADRFTGTTDSPFVVIDRCTGISVWAANAVSGSGNVINVSTFGAFRHDSNGLDRRNPLSTSSQNFRSRGVIPDSMMIRKDLMDHAKANGTDLQHVLEMFLVETDSAAGFVHPMIGAEGGKYGFGAEGTRVAVSPGVDLAARSCSPEALVIARTLQNYGAYIGDNSGSNTTLKAEQESAAHPVWGGTLGADELSGCITWNDFVVITPGWQ
jgi:hypothetical protein